MDGQNKGDHRSPSTNKQPAAEPSVAAAPASDAQKTEIYHVVGPGSLLRVRRRVVKLGDGKERELKETITVPPGELVELTVAEAKDLGALVALGEPPPPPPRVEERKAGKYRVKGPGSLLRANALVPPGTIVDLTEEDARTLGTAVESV